MNICFIAYFPIIPYRGGIQRVTTLLSRELVKRGHSVSYLCHSPKYKDLINDPFIEFPQFYIDIKDDGVNTIFTNFLSERKIDCVICQEQSKNSVLLLSMIPNAVKIVSVFHNMPFPFHTANRKSVMREFPYNTLKKAIYKVFALASPWAVKRDMANKEKAIYYNTLKFSDKFVFLSNRFFPRILSYIPDFPKEKLVAINNPNTFDAKIPFDYDLKKNIILWAGRVDPNKNCKDFLKAWHLFSVNNPDWLAVVAGDGPELIKCKKWAKKQVLKNITFLGYSNNIIKLYNEAKIFVSTSYKEGWPMTLNEAMSRGCVPCVYGTFDTVVDILEDEVSGFICEPKPENLAEKLNAIVSDEGRLKEMAFSSRLGVCKFSVSTICDKWEELLINIERN